MNDRYLFSSSGRSLQCQCYVKVRGKAFRMEYFTVSLKHDQLHYFFCLINFEKERKKREPGAK